MSWLIPIGVVAGILTTVTGVGGGMVALSLLSLAMTPAAALAVSAAAFTIGNAHRLLLYARAVERRVVARFGLGLGSGALVGAALVPKVPAQVLRLALAAVAVASLARALRQRWQAARSAAVAAPLRPPSPLGGGRLVAAGAVTGAIGAGAGGAGVLVAPLLLAAGLRRDAYVATVAACAIVLNGARVLGYALGGLYTAAMGPQVAVLALALVVGNLVGRAVRGRLPGELLDRIELAAPVVAIGLALAGL